MTRQEVEAWGLVGAGAVIIVLLLLDYAHVSPPNVSITEAAPPPAEQFNINIPAVPNQPLPPWQIVFPPLPTPEFNITIAQPCTCSCEALTEEQGAAFAAQVDQLNAMLKSEAINNASTYFSDTPYQDLFATNATGIGQFAAGVGLPAPIFTQDVTTPGGASLPGGGSISYTFDQANPYGS